MYFISLCTSLVAISHSGAGPEMYNNNDNNIYHIIYKSSNRNKVHDKFGIMYFENQITLQIRSRD